MGYTYTFPSVYPQCLLSLIDFEIWCIGRVLLVRGSRLKNELYTYTFPSVYPRCLLSLIDFQIRCIARVMLVRGSRLKNEVYIHVSQCLSSVFIFTD